MKLPCVNISFTVHGMFLSSLKHKRNTS